MLVRIRRASAAGAVACLLAWNALSSSSTSAQAGRGAIAVSARSVGQMREWDERLDRMIREGDLRVRQRRQDALVPGRLHERADQYFRGVRVFGADIARQLRSGQAVSVYGTLYQDIDVDTSATIGWIRALALVSARTGVELNAGTRPELFVLPLDGGGYALTWRVRVAAGTDARQYFVDAHSGATVLDYSDRKTQTAVIGSSRGVLGDTKKISVIATGGRFLTSDRKRPPAIATYDMQSNPSRVLDYLNRRVILTQNDLGSDADNDWSDGALDDAHVYAGWTYDYFFRRYGRRGLDNADQPIVSLVHPVRRADVFVQFEEFQDFFVNAFYDGGGVVVYGEGLPPNITIGGQTWDFLAGALDIVAHELTHGVTEYSSDLIYRNESGALNEAFSDMMGTSAEFFFQPAGNAALQADYLLAEDVVRPGGIRSMENPAGYGDPDHYSRRLQISADNGGVHANSGIPNHAFYLAIEGGTNRTSGMAVQGVGAANREQIEKVFYRAFTQMLPSSATFATARAATIQAARDLYGASSAAERAVTQAWTAVGVN